MAKEINLATSDTVIEGVSSLTFPRGLLNIAADWKVVSESSGKEVILTNLKSPRDKQERIRIAVAPVANVYNGAQIEPTAYDVSKKGVSILAQDTCVFTITDTADANYLSQKPVSVHMVIKAADSEYITAAHVQTCIGRLLSALFDTGSTATTRLEALLRGVVTPSEV